MKRALIFYGGYPGHAPQARAAYLADILRQEAYDVTVTDDAGAALGDMDALARYDLIVPCVSIGELDGEAPVLNLMEAVRRGACVWGCHTVCDAFRGQLKYQMLVGAQFVGHPGGHAVPYRVHIVPGAGLNMCDFDVVGEQFYLLTDPQIKVMAYSEFTQENDWFPMTVKMPVAYTKPFGKGRVFCCTLGHDERGFCQPLTDIMRQGLRLLEKGVTGNG